MDYSMWERLFLNWVNSLEITEEIKDISDVNQDTIQSIIYRLCRSNVSQTDDHSIRSDLNYFLEDNFPQLFKEKFSIKNREHRLIICVSVILFSSLILRNQQVVSRMCNLSQDDQILLRSLFNNLISTNLSLLNKEHLFEILVLIPQECLSDSFSSPLANSSMITEVNSSLSMNLMLDEKSKEIKDLNEKLMETESEKEELQIFVQELKKKLNLKEQEIEKKKKTIADLLKCEDDKLLESDDHVAALTRRFNKQIDQLQETINRLLQENDDLKVVFNESQFKLVENQKSLKELKCQKDELMELGDLKDGKIQELESCLSTLQKQLEVQKKLLCDIQENELSYSLMSSPGNINSESLDSNNIGHCLVIEAEKDVKELKDICEQKNLVIEEQKQKIRNLESDIVDASVEISNFEHLNHQLKQQLANSTQTVENLEKKVNELQMNIDSLQITLIESHKLVIDLEARCAEDQSTKISLEKTLNELKQECLEHKNSDFDKETLLSEKAELLKNLMDSKKRLTDEIEKSKHLEAVIQKLNEEELSRFSEFKAILKKKYNEDWSQMEIKYVREIQDLTEKVALYQSRIVKLEESNKKFLLKPSVSKSTSSINCKKENIKQRDKFKVKEIFSEAHKTALLSRPSNSVSCHEVNPDRLTVLKDRNSMLPPHLQTSYPVETHLLSPSKSYEGNFKFWGNQGKRKSQIKRSCSEYHLNKGTNGGQ